MMTVRTDFILGEILAERVRQEALKAQGKFDVTCADDIPDVDRLAIVAEEFGEASREVVDAAMFTRRLAEARCAGFIEPQLDGWRTALAGHRLALRKELVQLAAVAVAWIEGLDAERRNGRDG